MGKKKDKKAPKIHVELDNPYRSYFAGQSVVGRVVIRNRKAKKVKEVTILLEGKGRVQWRDREKFNTAENPETQQKAQSHQPTNRTRVVEYSAEEIYVSYKTSLVGDGVNFATIPEGVSTYPFHFALPLNLPSSFTSKIGLISYLLEVEVKQPALLKKSKKICLPFTVNGIFDLNLEQGAVLKQECKKIKGSNFLACRKGKLGFVLHLHNRSGFVPGEVLDFRAEISNGTNRKVNEVKATLQQVTSFYAEGKIKLVHRPVAEIKGPEIDQGEHEMWSPTNFNIPSLPPTRLGGGCRLIDVRYFLFFEMKISGLSDSFTGQLPVMIGTIPLRATFVQFRPAPQLPVMPVQQPQPAPYQNPPDIGHNQHKTEPVPSTSTQIYLPEESYSPGGNMDTPPSAPFFPDYPDLPPPSYSEAVASEGFTWNPSGSHFDTEDENENFARKGVDEGIMPISPPSSAPPMDEFIPNYITYNRKI